MDVFQMQGTLTTVVALALLLLKGFAFINALMWPPPAYVAADKMTKPAWVVLTGLGLAAALLMGAFGLINLLFTVAALVYVLDVRPALVDVSAPR